MKIILLILFVFVIITDFFLNNNYLKPPKLTLPYDNNIIYPSSYYKELTDKIIVEILSEARDILCNVNDYDSAQSSILAITKICKSYETLCFNHNVVNKHIYKPFKGYTLKEWGINTEKIASAEKSSLFEYREIITAFERECFRLYSNNCYGCDVLKNLLNSYFYRWDDGSYNLIPLYLPTSQIRLLIADNKEDFRAKLWLNWLLGKKRFYNVLDFTSFETYARITYIEKINWASLYNRYVDFYQIDSGLGKKYSATVFHPVFPIHYATQPEFSPYSISTSSENISRISRFYENGILCKSLDLSSNYNIMGLTLWDICRVPQEQLKKHKDFIRSENYKNLGLYEIMVRLNNSKQYEYVRLEYKNGNLTGISLVPHIK